MKNKREVAHVYLLEYAEINYIGSSVQKDIRFRTHRRNIRKCLGKDIKIEFTVLDIVSKNERYYWERFYSHLFLSWGFILKNKYLTNLHRIKRDAGLLDEIKKIRLSTSNKKMSYRATQYLESIKCENPFRILKPRKVEN